MNKKNNRYIGRGPANAIGVYWEEWEAPSRLRVRFECGQHLRDVFRTKPTFRRWPNGFVVGVVMVSWGPDRYFQLAQDSA